MFALCNSPHSWLFPILLTKPNQHVSLILAQAVSLSLVLVNTLNSSEHQLHSCQPTSSTTPHHSQNTKRLTFTTIIGIARAHIAAPPWDPIPDAIPGNGFPVPLASNAKPLAFANLADNSRVGVGTGAAVDVAIHVGMEAAPFVGTGF